VTATVLKINEDEARNAVAEGIIDAIGDKPHNPMRFVGYAIVGVSRGPTGGVAYTFMPNAMRGF